MLEDTLLWLGLVGLLGGISVGISLLEEEGDSFLRNVMFSTGIACAMFIYLFTVGEKLPWSPYVFLLSLFVGGIAVMLVAFAAHGNLRAAFTAGAIAGILMQVMVKILKPGSFGFTGIDDIPTAIDLLVTILAIAVVYYLLRHWGKDGEKWD